MTGQYAFLEVKSHIVCKIGDRFVECSSIDGNLLNIYALVLHVGLVYPPLALHCGLNHAEGASDVGDVLDD
jgi:hypothetical protein